MRLLVLITIFASWHSSAHAPKNSTYRLPIFDMHAHYHDHVHSALSPEDAIQRSQAAGIVGMLLSSWPGDGTAALYSLEPNKIIPGLSIYKNDSILNPHDRYTWHNSSDIPKLIEDALKTGKLPYKTIGEFHMFYDIKPTPVMKKVAKIAIKHDLILHVHGRMSTISNWMDWAGPKLRVLWAHSGVVCLGAKCPGGVDIPGATYIPTPEEVGQMLDKYPNLYVELSYRDSYGGPANITIMNGPDKGRLPKAWKDLILAHSDRIMLGTDPAIVERWNKMAEIADEMRGWLQDLPEDVAKDVAYRNALRLLHL